MFIKIFLSCGIYSDHPQETLVVSRASSIYCCIDFFSLLLWWVTTSFSSLLSFAKFGVDVRSNDDCEWFLWDRLLWGSGDLSRVLLFRRWGSLATFLLVNVAGCCVHWDENSTRRVVVIERDGIWELVYVFWIGVESENATKVSFLLLLMIFWWVIGLFRWIVPFHFLNVGWSGIRYW